MVVDDEITFVKQPFTQEKPSDSCEMESVTVDLTVDAETNTAVIECQGPENFRPANKQTINTRKSDKKLEILGDQVGHVAEEEKTFVKQVHKSKNSNEKQTLIKEVGDINTLKSKQEELDKQKTENKALQETSRDLLKQTKVLKEEHTKLLKLIECRNAENSDCKQKLQTASKIFKTRNRKFRGLKKILLHLMLSALFSRKKIGS